MTKQSIIFLTCASAEWGLGHISRMFSLSVVFSQAEWQVEFRVNQDSNAIKYLQDRQQVVSHWLNPAGIIESLGQTKDLTIVVIDLAADLYAEVLPTITQCEHIRSVVIDYQAPGSQPDLTIIPALQTEKSTFKPSAKAFAGLEWILINPELSQIKRTVQPEPTRILISAGGSLDALTQYESMLQSLSKNFQLIFVIGPYSDLNAWQEKLNQAPWGNTDVIQNPIEPLQEYAKCEAALVLFGVTAYEVMALGLATFIIGTRHEHDEPIVNDLQAQGYCLHWEDKMLASPEQLTTLIREQRGTLSRLSIDIDGCDRIKQKIAQLLEGEAA